MKMEELEQEKVNSNQYENYEGMEISDTLAVDTLSFHSGSFTSFAWLSCGVSLFSSLFG